MRRLPRRSLALLVTALLLGACGEDVAEVPLASGSLVASEPPPDDARLIFTSNLYAEAPSGALQDVFADGSGGDAPTRLTFCNNGGAVCDQVEAAPASDGRRVALRRLLQGGQGPGLVFVDLARGVEAELLPVTAVVTGADWARGSELIVISGRGVGGLDDLWRLQVTINRGNPANPHDVSNLTSTGDVAERRPRLDRDAQVAVYERGGASAKSEIWIFQNQATQTRVTSGGPGTDPLPGSPYLVGSDADPAFSPDAGSVVFRRLTGTGLPQGTWDVVSVGLSADRPLRVLASGEAYRGAPDWGPDGIVFVEQSAAAGPRLIEVQPDGSGRRELLGLGADGLLSYPRWLP